MPRGGKRAWRRQQLGFVSADVSHTDQTGGNVEQAETNQVRFRELDQQGQPADPEAASGGLDPAGTGAAGRRWFNPFIAILWILAAGLVFGGIWGFTNAFSGSTSSSGAVPLSFVLVTFAPFAALSGTLAIVCLLFWHAIQWQRASH